MSCVLCALIQKHSQLTNSKARVNLCAWHNKILCCTSSLHVLPLIFLLSAFDAESSFFGTPGPALSPIPLLSVTLLPLTAVGGWLRLIFWARKGLWSVNSTADFYFQSSWDKITVVGESPWGKKWHIRVRRSVSVRLLHWCCSNRGLSLEISFYLLKDFSVWWQPLTWRARWHISQNLQAYFTYPLGKA